MKLLYETSYKMRTNDFTCYDTITPTSILDSFQDVAGIHASMLKMGFTDMLNKGYYWVVSRERVSVLGNVLPGETIKVLTWPEPKKGVSFIRNYKMLNSKDEIVAVGSSLWVVINSNTRRLERARDIDYEGEIIDEIIYEKLNKLDEIEMTGPVYNHQVKFSDLDHNKHMNNSKYMEIFLNIIDLKENEKILNFQLDFIHEAKEKEILQVKYLKIDNKYHFAGYINDSLAIRAEIEVENA